MITASIVIHRPDLAQLRRCMECVLSCPDVARLYIVDNSPAACVPPFASSSRVEYRHVVNRGFGAGHNEAIRDAFVLRPDAHLVLNADTWWEGDVIGDMARYMASDAGVGMMMPKVYYPDGDLQLTPRRLPTPWDMVAKRFLPRCLVRRRVDRYLLAAADHDVIIDSPYLLGSFLLFRREALEAEGLFDERFFMYPEDIDITRRIHARWRTLHYPAVSIVHCHAAASRRNWRMLRIHVVNMARYFNKWGWWRDPQRRAFNRRLEREIKPIDGPLPPQRG